MREDQGTNETLRSSKNDHGKPVSCCIKYMPGNRYASALTNNGDRYGNTAVYSKSFVFMIACSEIKSVGTQIKEQPLLWDPSIHSGDRHSC